MTRELTHLHKILIQMQRESYQNVRKLAMDHPELYMSLIIDGENCSLRNYFDISVNSIFLCRNVPRSLCNSILWW
jgi:hypothetical protein